MKKLLLLSLSLSFFSCSDENEKFAEKPELNPIEVVNKEFNLNQYETAINTVKRFDLKLQNTGGKVSTKSLDINLSEINVISAEEIIYTFDLEAIVMNKESNNASLRSSSMNNKESVNPEMKIYTITFEKDGKKGFAIATGDERVKDGIYAFVPEGNLSDTTFNVGLRDVLYNMQNVYENDLVEYYNNSNEITTYASTKYTLEVTPLTGLNWGGSSPYNKNLPYCPSSGTNINAGSVAVACAQVSAYLSPPSIEKAYNLESIRDISRFFSNGSGAGYEDVARFYANIALLTNTSYDCNNRTSTSAIRNIRNDFDSWSVSHSYADDKNIDLESLAYNLYKAYPHITSGFTKNPRQGHAWVWEGIYCSYSSIDNSAKKIKLTNDIKLMLYCNWGWHGVDNGWFSDFERPTGKATYLDDNCQIYIKSIGYHNSDISARSKVNTYAL
jgi:hypothetical protein